MSDHINPLDPQDLPDTPDTDIELGPLDSTIPSDLTIDPMAGETINDAATIPPGATAATEQEPEGSPVPVPTHKPPVPLPKLARAAPKLTKSQSSPRRDGPHISYEVRLAIQEASKLSGYPDTLLAAFAHTESSYGRGGNPKTSSARGLYQFTSSTWGQTVRTYGHKYPEIKTWDRNNHRHQSLMMAELTKQNAASFEKAMGRAPTGGELYGLHFLGAGGMKSFAKRSALSSSTAAAPYHHQAAKANRNIFYHRNGRARSFAQVQAVFDKKASYAPGWDITPTADATPPIETVQTASATPPTDIDPLITQVRSAEDIKEFAERNGQEDVDLPAKVKTLDLDKFGNVVVQNNAVPPTRPPLPEPPVPGTPPEEPEYGQAPITAKDLYVPSITSTKQRAAYEEARMEEREQAEIDRGGWWGLSADAVNLEWPMTWFNAGRTDILPDPDFTGLSQERFKELTAGLPEHYHSLFEEARSDEQAIAIRADALNKAESERHLADAGVTGFAAQMLAAFTNPVDVLLAVGSGGLVGAAAKGGRLVRAVKTGAVGAGVNVGIEAVHDLQGDVRTDLDNYLIAGVAGFGLGAIGGAIARPIVKETGHIAELSRDIVDELQAPSQNLPGSVGAARTGSTDPFTNNEAIQKLSQADAPEGAGILRYDSAGQLAQSKNPMARMLSSLGEDAVGKKGHAVNPFSASEDATRLFKSWSADLARTDVPQFRAWMKSRGYPWHARWSRRGEFNDQVTAYVRNRSSAAVDGFAPEVKAVGEKVRKLNADIRELASNPGRDSGRLHRPVQGFDEIPNDPSYMPRVFSPQAIRELVEEFGETNVAGLIRGAIKSAQPQIDEALLARLSSGFTRAITRRAHGLDDTIERAMLGERDALERILKDYAGDLADNQIDEILDAADSLRAQGSDAGNISRAKHRVLLDESFSSRLVDKTGTGTREVKFSDLLVNDAHTLSASYFRQMSGQISLARFRVLNPSTNDLLLDGITSKADFERVVKVMREKGADSGMSAADLQVDEDNLRFIHGWIVGNPVGTAQEGKLADVLRLLRKFNFVRIMNQVGFAQIPEMAATISTVGFKASLQHMPALRRVLNMDGELVLRHGLDEELEAIFGLGSDMLTGASSPHRYDDLMSQRLSAPDRGRALDRVEGVLDEGMKATSILSGMSPITAAMHRWTMKAVAQKFANLADSKVTKATMDRMKSLGISDELLPRILSQVDQHFSQETGLLFGKKVKLLNLNKWDDLEAKAAFEGALFRWTRRVIQENDVGNLNRWMSSPMVQTIFQFRTFMLGANFKQLQHNLHLAGALGSSGSPENVMRTFSYFAMSSTFGGMVYIVREKLKAIGRDDADEYLERRLSLESIGKASFANSGYASVLPTAIDSSMMLLGNEPMFDFRSTGQPSDVLFGNPTADLANTFTKGIASPIKGAITEGRSPSQQELRTAERLMPFGNFLPVLWTFNRLIGEHGGGFEQYAPR